MERVSTNEEGIFKNEKIAAKEWTEHRNEEQKTGLKEVTHLDGRQKPFKGRFHAIPLFLASIHPSFVHLYSRWKQLCFLVLNTWVKYVCGSRKMLFQDVFSVVKLEKREGTGEGEESESATGSVLPSPLFHQHFQILRTLFVAVFCR